MMRDTYYDKRTLYRSRDGIVFGVCEGIAKSRGLNVLWVRVAACALLCLFFPVVLPLYFAAGILMEPESRY